MNQDKLGIQAKRIFTTAPCQSQKPDKEYIQDNERVDILKKPLADGSFALSIINLSEKNASASFSFSLAGVSADDDGNTEYSAEDLWTGKVETVRSVIQVPALKPCDNITLKLTAK